MAGNTEGGIKCRQSMIDRMGEEAYREHMRSIGTKGGKAFKTKPAGFAADRDRASWAGRIGGRRSKRPKRAL